MAYNNHALKDAFFQFKRKLSFLNKFRLFWQRGKLSVFLSKLLILLRVGKTIIWIFRRKSFAVVTKMERAIPPEDRDKKGSAGSAG